MIAILQGFAAQDCNTWCQLQGFDRASKPECETLGGCIKGQIFFSESSEVCPATLEGCCCMNAEPDTDFNVQKIMLNNSYLPGETLTIKIYFENYRPGRYASVSIINPALVTVWIKDFNLTSSNLTVNYTLPVDAENGVWSVKVVAISDQNRVAKTKNFVVGESSSNFSLIFLKPIPDKISKNSDILVSIFSSNPLTSEPISLQEAFCSFNPDITFELRERTSGIYETTFTIPNNLKEGNYTLICTGRSLDGRTYIISKSIYVISPLTVDLKLESKKNNRTISLIVTVLRDENPVENASLTLYLNDTPIDINFKYLGDGRYKADHEFESLTGIRVEAEDPVTGTITRSNWVWAAPKKENPLLKFLLYGFSGLTALFLILGLVLIIRHRHVFKRTILNDDQLSAWVQEQISKGVDLEEIKRQLVFWGYRPEIAEMIIKENNMAQ